MNYLCPGRLNPSQTRKKKILLSLYHFIHQHHLQLCCFNVPFLIFLAFFVFLLSLFFLFGSALTASFFFFFPLPHERSLAQDTAGSFWYFSFLCTAFFSGYCPSAGLSFTSLLASLHHCQQTDQETKISFGFQLVLRA